MVPMLYTEHDLLSVAGSSPPEGAPNLVKHWLSAGPASELQRRIGTELRATGFDWMCCSTLEWRDGVPTTTRLLSSHAPPNWSQRRFGGGFSAVDPRLQQVLSSALPFAWSVSDASSWQPHEHMLPAPMQFSDLLRSCGMASGVLIVLPAGPRSHERSLVSLSARRTGRAWIDDDVLGKSLLFALCLHELLSVHMRVGVAGDEHAASVSPTRQEILWHLAQGQSNKQIAYRLELSTDTVKYHLRELMRQFNVHNRMQLLNVAGADTPSSVERAGVRVLDSVITMHSQAIDRLPLAA